MNRDTNKKRNDEKKLVSRMIAVYCRKKHRQLPKKIIKIRIQGKEISLSLCDECASLLGYAMKRADLCPFMQEKTFCSNCKVHCYTPDMRGKIKNVMRFSGPHLLFTNPVTVVRHLIESKREWKRSRANPDKVTDSEQSLQTNRRE
ncbi:MAG: nitrous oxide-stimulated promoter family protein [Bacillota bacterium]|nr:nitrous oxide-stimulated promoter family protein [Bacillota bacterium]